jgi:acyl-coenzyme A thioesterase PaaI-like protein
VYLYLLSECCAAANGQIVPRRGPRSPASLPATSADGHRQLRIDYVKPATPGRAVIAEADRITHSVAFTRAFAHHGDAKDPIAAAAGTFMLGTKGEVTRPQSIGTEAMGLEIKP